MIIGQKQALWEKTTVFKSVGKCRRAINSVNKCCSYIDLDAGSELCNMRIVITAQNHHVFIYMIYLCRRYGYRRCDICKTRLPEVYGKAATVGTVTQSHTWTTAHAAHGGRPAAVPGCRVHSLVACLQT